MYRIGEEEIAAAKRVIESKKLFKISSSGLHETMHAEEELCQKFGTENALIMTSGHAALASALIALGIGPGDQVIVPAYTYIATAMAVLEAGAIPVLAEINETMTIDPDDLEAKITESTKAVIPVHIKGFPCDMARIMNIAEKHGIFVVEDACQADGASFRGKRLGTIGDAGAYSFNYYKIISMGEGGALVTDRREVFERALIYHDSSAVAFFGDQLNNFTTELFCGSEYRTNEIATAILREQLKKLDGIITDLRKNKKRLTDRLSSLCRFIPSNDPDGDLGTTAAIIFDTEAEAIRFGEEIGASPVINTGKHVYSNWAPILEKRGALHPLMDPFKMEANRSIIPDYTIDMCPITLDILSRTVYVEIDPDWTEEALEKITLSVSNGLAKARQA